MTQEPSDWDHHDKGNPVDNPPAFPTSDQQVSPNMTGMTMRDYFAAHSPIRLEDALATQKHQRDAKPAESALEYWVKLRYDYADQMLKARGAKL
jgi:hypothetical protein